MPDDPRAVALFEELNKRFFEFVDQLPPLLKKAARSQKTYLGSPDEDDFEGIPGLNPVLAATPWLFWETFSVLQDETLLEISEAGSLYVLASILLDHIIDGQAEPVEEVTLLQKEFYRNGTVTYRNLFTSNSEFWKHFDRLGHAHMLGITLEMETQRTTTDIELDDLQIMANGKVSPIVTTIAALSEASGQPEKLGPIEDSLKHIAVASQLLDDVGDWRHDVEVNHRTYFLAQIAAPGRSKSVTLPSLSELESMFEEHWPDVDHLHKVIEWLDDSEAVVAGLDCPAWISYVRGYRELADRNLSGAIAGHLARKIHPLVQDKDS
jgi:hypothetical protein